ncbi:MAG TPA: hydrogenase maturation protease [Solirubrobacteraceae bacterium]
MIGVGNALRGDDAVGLEVAGRLADLRREPGVEVRAYEGEGVGLIDLWEGAGAVVLIDCMRSGAAPGTVRRIDASSTAVRVPLRGTSSHATGVAEAIELARALGALPETVVVHGVEGASFATGAELSEAVAGALVQAEDAARAEVLRLLAGPRRGSRRRARSAPAP